MKLNSKENVQQCTYELKPFMHVSHKWVFTVLMTGKLIFSPRIECSLLSRLRVLKCSDCIVKCLPTFIHGVSRLKPVNLIIQILIFYFSKCTNYNKAIEIQGSENKKDLNEGGGQGGSP